MRPEMLCRHEIREEAPMSNKRAVVDVFWALLIAGTLASPIRAQQSHSVYYALPSWAPDGKSIVFESNRDGEAAVYTIRPDGSGLTRLTPNGSLGEQPSWSPDGRQLVFASDRDGVSQLYHMKPDGSDVVALTGTTNGFLATYSPDGRWLLFAAQNKRPSSQYRVFVMHPDGSNRLELGDSTKSNEEPCWTKDGQRIVFTEVSVVERLPNEAPKEFIRRRTESQRLLSIKPDGMDARIIQPGERDRITRDLGLSPDGMWMVYSRQVDGITGLFLKRLPSGTERLLDRGNKKH